MNTYLNMYKNVGLCLRLIFVWVEKVCSHIKAKYYIVNLNFCWLEPKTMQKYDKKIFP